MPNDIQWPAPETLGEVVRWVIEETDALCPSPERLASYAAFVRSGRHQLASRPRMADPLCDIRYHVEEAHCRLCRAELEHLTVASV
jgi:hypothetical protein